MKLHALGPKPERWGARTSIETKLIGRLTNYQDVGVCWNVTGATDRHGYGLLYHDGTKWRAHRLAQVLWTGPIPEGHAVLHECGTLLCCNPAHLYTAVLAHVDTAEARRLRAKPAKLTPDQVRAIRVDERTQTEIARQYGVSENAISNLKLGKTYRQVAG